MPLVITPEVGIPLPFDVTPEEAEQFRERAKAAFSTLSELMDAGAEIPVGTENSTQAHEIIAQEKKFNVAKTAPGTILKLEALLDTYDHEFLDATRRFTNFITARLLEETEDEDPKVRLKALEMLGKRRGINLFSDQMEITIKQKPSEEIEARLNKILERYMGDAIPVEAKEVREDEEPSPMDIDLDAELGLKNDADTAGTDKDEPSAA